MNARSEWSGIPGADPDVPTLAQEWWIASWPAPEEIAELVDAFAQTMRVPLRRFNAINESLVHDAKGSWTRSRDKALTVLRDGDQGNRVIHFGVSSYNHGGYNWYPESYVGIYNVDDDRGRFIAVRCEHALVAEDDADRIAASWAKVVEEHLDLIGEPGRPIVGRHENGDVVEFRPNVTGDPTKNQSSASPSHQPGAAPDCPGRVGVADLEIEPRTDHARIVDFD